MLCLTRGRGESIIVGDATVTILEFRPGQRVRLGIDAPREVPVHRREVHDAIVRERGPYSETRRVPVELLRRIAARLDEIRTTDVTAVLEADELSKIINPPSERKDGR